MCNKTFCAVIRLSLFYNGSRHLDIRKTTPSRVTTRISEQSQIRPSLHWIQSNIDPSPLLGCFPLCDGRRRRDKTRRSRLRMPRRAFGTSVFRLSRGIAQNIVREAVCKVRTTGPRCSSLRILTSPFSVSLSSSRVRRLSIF